MACHIMKTDVYEYLLLCVCRCVLMDFDSAVDTIDSSVKRNESEITR